MDILALFTRGLGLHTGYCIPRNQYLVFMWRGGYVNPDCGGAALGETDPGQAPRQYVISPTRPSVALTPPAGMDLATSMSDQPAPLRRWHAIAESKNPALLDDLLADQVVFRSPAVFAPQEGKALTTSYLSAALKVLGPSLRYVSQWHDHAGAVLEFEADLEGVYVQGVDILRWNAEGKLVSFTVMVRPLRGLQKLVELMAVELAAGQA